jgi:zinc transporter ZupT
VTLAIGLHNVPEGLAVATVMAAKGTPPHRALLWTALTAAPQALVAPPAYVFVDACRCARACVCV